MNVVNQIPSLRFPEFEASWTKVKLKDVSLYFNGGSFEGDVQESGKYELITLKSINTLGNLVSSERYIDTDVETLSKGTLVMILSEQAPGLLGITALIPKDNFFVLNQRVAEIRPNQSVDSFFLSMAINRNQRYFSKMGAGMKVQNISKPNVQNYEFFQPNLSEQQKIASFLSSVDKKIKLLEQKKDLLEQYKKGVMQQIFSQQIRFKDDDGNEYPDWKKMKLGEISDISIGEFVIKTKQNPNSKYPVYNGGKSYTGFYDYFNNEGDKIIISARGANAGFVNYEKSRFWAGNSCYSVDIVDKIRNNVQFIFNFIKFNQNLFTDYQQAANIPSVSKKDVQFFKIQLPKIEEQNKIANFLTFIEDKIKLVNKQLENTEEFKKGLLQQMFV